MQLIKITIKMTQTLNKLKSKDDLITSRCHLSLWFLISHAKAKGQSPNMNSPSAFLIFSCCWDPNEKDQKLKMIKTTHSRVIFNLESGQNDPTQASLEPMVQPTVFQHYFRPNKHPKASAQYQICKTSSKRGWIKAMKNQECQNFESGERHNFRQWKMHQNDRNGTIFNFHVSNFQNIATNRR